MTRGGAFAWTTGLLRGNLICGVTSYGEVQWWNINNGRCAGSGEELDDLDLIEKLSINWLANDGIWFQAVEKRFGMGDAKRCNDTCWTRYSPYEAARIKRLLNLPEQGGIPSLQQALSLRMYAFINTQSIEIVDEHCLIFYMNDCRVQAARKRKGLPDYPCKSAGMVEYPAFARTIDARIRTECVGCPPDPHPDGWFCAWKFFIDQP